MFGKKFEIIVMNLGTVIIITGYMSCVLDLAGKAI